MTRGHKVGIIGLGRRWQRYRSALLLLRREFKVRAVYDPISHRAVAAAKLFSCDAAGGCSDLLERDDVEAVLLLDHRWFGLWPLQRACALGKAVFCTVPLAADDADAETLQSAVEASRLPVLMAHPLACAPALDRLRNLVGTTLGPARLVRADFSYRLYPRSRPNLLRTAAAAALVDLCVDLLGGPPTRVTALASESGEAVTVLQEHGEGRAAQINLWAGLAVSSGCRVEVIGPQGAAKASGLSRLSWRDQDGQYAERLRHAPTEDDLLLRFAQALHNGQQPQPGFADAFRSLTWLRCAWNNLATRLAT
jgi:predicted dehydrogenase